MAYWKVHTFSNEWEAENWLEENGFDKTGAARWEDMNGRWAVIRWEDGYKALIGSEQNDLGDIDDPS